MKLETERLILRPIKNSDRESIVENINDINVSKWLLVVPYPYTEKDAMDWIKISKSKWRTKEKKEYNFGIELKDIGKIIGGIGINKIDNRQGKASVGYWLGKKHHRKGYASEALREILNFAFNEIGLRRIEAGVFEGNPSSGKLLEKFGSKQEGMKRLAYKCMADDKIKNEICYGLLKEEYKK